MHFFYIFVVVYMIDKWSYYIFSVYIAFAFALQKIQDVIEKIRSLEFFSFLYLTFFSDDIK